MIIPLSPMDYYFYRRKLYTIQFLFEYDGQIESQLLRQSLFKITDIFRVLRSGLRIISEHEIVFEDQKINIPIQVKTLEFDPDLTVPQHADFFIDAVENKPGQPLVKFSISYSTTQSFVGISFSHMVGDGYSFFIFLKALSQICLGRDVQTYPNNNRSHLQPEDLTVSDDASLDYLFKTTGYSIPLQENSKTSIFEKIHFSGEYLAALKKGVQSSPTNKISSNDIIMGLLLKKYSKQIPLSSTGDLIVRCPVDYRKIYPGLSENYFGNAICDAVAIFNPKTLDEMTLSEVVSEIRKKITFINEENIKKSLQSLDALRRVYGISIFENVGCPGLLVSNLSKFPFHEIDFGLGAPKRVHHTTQNFQLAIVLPHPDGLEIRLNLFSSRE